MAADPVGVSRGCNGPQSSPGLAIGWVEVDNGAPVRSRCTWLETRQVSFRGAGCDTTRPTRARADTSAGRNWPTWASDGVQGRSTACCGDASGWFLSRFSAPAGWWDGL